MSDLPRSISKYVKLFCAGTYCISVNYLLGQEEYGEDLLEIITVYKSLKDPKIKGIASDIRKNFMNIIDVEDWGMLYYT